MPEVCEEERTATYTTEEVVLQIELPSRWAVGFN